MKFENVYMKKLIVSPAPHAHSKENTQRLMLDVIIALLPAYLASVYFFGLGALNVAVTAVLSCVFVEYAIGKWIMKKPSTIKDCSAILTGLLLAMNVPSSAPWWIMFLGAVFAIGVTKMTFGGLGQNPFNPALAGRVFLLISFPVQMTNWPLPKSFATLDAVTGATPLGLMKEGLAKGLTVEQIMDTADFSYWELLYGNIGGTAGEISSIALLLGFVYLLSRRVIRLHIPLSIFTSIVLFSGILWMINPARHADPLFHLLTGGVLLGAVFMATDYVTSPMHPRAMIIFGAGIGIITILIRVFGAYPEGISFAIIIMNAAVPLMNKYMKPKRYGEEIKHG